LVTSTVKMCSRYFLFLFAF